MYGLRADAEARVRELLRLLPLPRSCSVAVCPPFTALETVAPLLLGSGIRLGAQDLHWEVEGAFTGEVSGPMLRDAGCELVIVGHSERRHGLGEDDAAVARKLRAALAAGLSPIVCVGELLAEREAGRTDPVISSQVSLALAGLSRDLLSRLSIAYEPVWAIGTGLVASPAQAREAHALIRQTVERTCGAGAGSALSILYGGSVKPENAAALFAEPEVDGALVGGASLDPRDFARIAASAGGGTT